MPRISNRQDDEALLQWIGWRAEGFTARNIAKYVGAKEAWVARATREVRDADVAHAGAHVLEAYWP